MSAQNGKNLSQDKSYRALSGWIINRLLLHNSARKGEVSRAIFQESLLDRRNNPLRDPFQRQTQKGFLLTSKSPRNYLPPPDEDRIV